LAVKIADKRISLAGLQFSFAMENKSPGSCSSIISSSTPGPGGNNLMNNKVANGGSPDSTTTNSSAGIGNHGSSNNTSARSSSPTPNMYSLKWNTQLLALQRSLANLWDNGIGTDAVLLCQGTPLPVHKIVLTAASPYVASVVQVSEVYRCVVDRNQNISQYTIVFLSAS
ncbi:unnamed protein product, partial [Allacma fusca]